MPTARFAITFDTTGETPPDEIMDRIDAFLAEEFMCPTCPDIEDVQIQYI